MTIATQKAPKYSHLTQKLLNYFPDTDVRIRENPISIGAQLLNSVAYQMEQQQTRINRELRALNLSDMPMNIDNTGVYYASRVPLSFTLTVNSQGVINPPPTIRGHLKSSTILPFFMAWEIPSISAVTLKPYDDTLPIPTRVSQDPVIKPVAFTNPQLFSTVGNGSPVSFSPGTLPISNYLTFRVLGMGPETIAFTVSITGELDPPAVWPQDIHTKNEVLIISDDGLFKTDSVWSSVRDITITGLPTACSLVCYSMSFGLPIEPDTDRPLSHFGYRGVAFPRYWQLHDLLLSEVYQRNRFSGYETYQTYSLSKQMVDMAVEPNTGGLFLTDGTNLLYADRRTPVPDHLDETGNTQEPAFGLNIWYDYTNPGDTRYAYVSPLALSQAGSVTQYRYVVEDPNGNLYVLLPTGVLQQYTGSSGWTQGTPKPVSFALTVVGTYIISLETLGSFNAKTVDIFPYSNLALTSVSTINLASLVPSVQGIAFDAYDKLWVWTGQFAIPIKLSYDAYLWDPSTRTIYATDKYDSISIYHTKIGQWDFRNSDESGMLLIGV